MIEKRKHHFDLNETKTDIIKFIIKSGPVSEPDISKFIDEKYGGFDRATVNKHLNKLDGIGCIEKVSSVKKSRLNYWDVKTLKNLKNIRSNFSEIRLNEYEKVLAIVLHGNGYTIKELVGLQIYMRLFLSPSFFNMCLDTDFETMCLRSWKIYQQNKGVNFHKYIQKFLAELQNDLDTDSFDFNSLMETFLKIVKELPIDVLTIQADELCEIVDEKITKSQPDENVAVFLSFMIMDYLDIFNSSLLVLLSDHFCDHDILLNVASDDEIKFVAKTNDNLALYKKSREAYIDNDAFKKWTSDDLENISEIIFDFKTPSFFPVHNNSKDLYQYLLKFYEKDLKIEKPQWSKCPNPA